MVRWCWANFQCRGVLLIWIKVRQGPTVLAVGAGGGCLDIFSLVYPFSLPSPSLWETARNRLKYCLKGPLNPKQPTNQRCQSASSVNILYKHKTESKWVVVRRMAIGKKDFLQTHRKVFLKTDHFLCSCSFAIYSEAITKHKQEFAC